MLEQMNQNNCGRYLAITNIGKCVIDFSVVSNGIEITMTQYDKQIAKVNTLDNLNDDIDTYVEETQSAIRLYGVHPHTIEIFKPMTKVANDYEQKPKYIPGTKIDHPVYKEGKRYTKTLRFVKISGNSNRRYVDFVDPDGTILTWETNDYTKAYKDLQITGVYKFTVQYTLAGTIFIQRLQRQQEG